MSHHASSSVHWSLFVAFVLNHLWDVKEVTHTLFEERGGSSPRSGDLFLPLILFVTFMYGLGGWVGEVKHGVIGVVSGAFTC